MLLQHMISELNQLRLHSRKGFSLIEVILTISIIGVLSTTLLPTYNYMNKRSNEIEIEKRALVFENDIYDSLNRFQSYKSFDYPIIGILTDDTVGFLNIGSTELISFTNTILSNTTAVKYYDNILSRELTAEPYFYGRCELNMKIVLKTGEIVTFNFIAYDNELNYKDYAYLKSVILQDEKGYSKEIKIL